MKKLSRHTALLCALHLVVLPVAAQAQSTHYTYGGFRTLEEAESDRRTSSPLADLAFSLPHSQFGSTHAAAGIVLDYRQYGALYPGGSILVGPAQGLTSRFGLHVREWPPQTTNAACQSPWTSCPAGVCATQALLVAAAQCEFDHSWNRTATPTLPAYCFQRQGAPATTSQFGAPTVVGAGTPSGILRYAPGSSTASGWGATFAITMTPCAGTSAPAVSAKSATTTTWNTSKEEEVSCPAGTKVNGSATGGSTACTAGDLQKTVINTPFFTQSPPTCGGDSGDGNPCYGSNGNKRVDEPGFTYGRISFSVHYNSLRQTKPYAYIDRNWTHPFATRILTEWSVPNHLVGPETAGADFAQSVFVQNAMAELEPYRRSGGSGPFLPVGTNGKELHYIPGANGVMPSWRLEHSSGLVEHFDRAGRLVQRSTPDDPAGTLQIAYLGAPITGPYGGSSTPQVHELFWRIGTVTDGLGRSVRFEYEDAQFQRLRRIVADDEVELMRFEYDTGRRLERIVHAGGGTRTFIYNESQHIFVGGTTPAGIVGYWLTGIADERGQRFATYRYDDRGRVIESWRGAGHNKVVLSYATDSEDSWSRVTYPSGRTVTSQYVPNTLFRQKASEQDSGGGEKTFTYTAARRLERITTEDGRVTKLEYDPAGIRIIKRTEGLGTPQQRRLETDWHAGSDRVHERRIYADPTNSEAGTLEHRETFAYDGAGRRTQRSIIDPQNPLRSRNWAWTYCSAADVANHAITGCALEGQLKSLDGPRAGTLDTTLYAYRPTTDQSGCTNPTGNCWRRGDLWKVTNALGHVTEVLSYDRAGRPRRIRDPNLVVTDFEYSPRGTLRGTAVRGTNSASEADDAITVIGLDAAELPGTMTGPGGDAWTFLHDAAGRLYEMQLAGVGRIHHQLDDEGNVVTETTFGQAGIVKRVLRRSFDAMGRLEAVLDADGQGTLHDYDADGHVDFTVDALGRRADREHDALGRLARLVRDADLPQGTVPEAVEAEALFGYDARGNLRSVRDPNLLTTTYVVDGLGDVTSRTSPDTGTWNFTYNLDGTLLSSTDARGRTVNYQTDRLGRRTGMTVTDWRKDVIYAYDLPATTTGCPGGWHLGRLSRITDDSGTLTLCYDHRGNVVRRTQTIRGGGPAIVTAYEYSLDDQVTRITYPSGTVVDYVLGPDRRAASMAVNGQPLLTAIERAPWGAVESLQFANGRLLTKTLDLSYRVSAIGDGAGGMEEAEFRRNALGDIDQWQLGRTMILGYGYDRLDRLASVEDTKGPREGFAYDATGNRIAQLQKQWVDYTYHPGTHRLESDGTTGLRGYDANGNTVSISGRNASLVYDDFNRLVEYRTGGTLYGAYTHNGLGQRVRKGERRSCGGTPCSFLAYTAFTYSPGGELLGEYDHSTTAMFTIREYVYLEGTPVAITGQAGLHYVMSDHLGTPRAVVEPARDVAVWTWPLSGAVFGDHPPATDPDGDGAPYVLPLRFPGQYADAEAGTSYNYFRDYEPGIGRYLESDPLGLSVGPATYAYALSSPIGAVDPLGLEPTLVNVPPSLEQQVLDAVEEAKRKLRECQDARACWNGDDQRERLIETLDDARILYEANADYCGEASRFPGANTIRISPFTFNWSACCDIASTLAHEANHLGRPFSNGSEDTSRELEKRCFDCPRPSR